MILVFYCTGCALLFCNFVCTYCSLTPSQCTVAALSYDFTDEVIIADEVSTVRFVATRLSPLKEYCASIVHTPGDITSRQES